MGIHVGGGVRNVVGKGDGREVQQQHRFFRENVLTRPPAAHFEPLAFVAASIDAPVIPTLFPHVFANLDPRSVSGFRQRVFASSTNTTTTTTTFV